MDGILLIALERFVLFQSVLYWRSHCIETGSYTDIDQLTTRKKNLVRLLAYAKALHRTMVT